MAASMANDGTSLDRSVMDLDDEPQSLHIQLQQDLHALLQYTMVLIRENNALKTIIRSSLSDNSHTHNEFTQSLLSSHHELPKLRSLSVATEPSRAADNTVSSRSTSLSSDTSTSSVKKLYQLTFEDSYINRARSSTDLEPKFFTEDMLSLISERIELKETVQQLKDKLDTMQSESETTTESPDVPTPATKIFTPVIGNRERCISDVCVVDFRKHSKGNVFVIKTIWSDGERFELYRTYGDFFTFDRTLQQLFPVEAGKPIRQVLPVLPNKIFYALRKLRKSTTIDELKTRLNTYCRTLLLRLSPSVAQAMYVVNFFKAYPMDKQLERLRKPRSQSQSEEFLMSVYPQDSPAGSLFEEYTVIVDYEQAGEGELTVKAGETVTVLRREDSGWWLVEQHSSGQSQRLGFVPEAFLKPLDVEEDEEKIRASTYLGFVSSILVEPEPEPVYVAVEDYFSQDSRQLTFSAGDQLILLEKSDDGWWLLAHNGHEGWAPANFIKPVNSASDGAKASASEPMIEEYVVNNAYQAQTEDEISLSKGSVVTVVEVCDTGWWKVNSAGTTGMAPASLLSPTPAAGEEGGGAAHDISRAYSAAAIFGPPPRSTLPRSNTHNLTSGRTRKKGPLAKGLAPLQE